MPFIPTFALVPEGIDVIVIFSFPSLQVPLIFGFSAGNTNTEPATSF